MTRVRWTKGIEWVKEGLLTDGGSWRCPSARMRTVRPGEGRAGPDPRWGPLCGQALRTRCRAERCLGELLRNTICKDTDLW